MTVQYEGMPVFWCESCLARQLLLSNKQVHLVIKARTEEYMDSPRGRSIYLLCEYCNSKSEL
jgi:hypothetical protein